MITSWGGAIITSFTNALNLVFSFIPKLFGFLVLLLIGWIVATAVAKAVTFLLRKVGFDRLATRVGLSRLEQNMNIKLDAAGVLGKVVYWFVFLIFLIPAFDSLGLTTITNILNEIIAYIPNVFVAILVLFLGTIAATVVADLVRGFTASTHVGNPSIFAAIARWSIIGFAALIALEQLHIAPALIDELFGGIVIAAALAFGLSFGLGGRETAQRFLSRSEVTVNNAAAQASMQRNINQAQAAQMQTMAPHTTNTNTWQANQMAPNQVLLQPDQLPPNQASVSPDQLRNGNWPR